VEQTVRRTATITPQSPVRRALATVRAWLKNVLWDGTADHGTLAGARLVAELQHQHAEREFYRQL
jgi:hypothetical protein